MLPISAKDRVPVIPPDCEGQDDPPTYYVKPASVFERAAFNREMTLRGAAYPSDAQAYAVMRAVIRESAPANAEALLEAVDAVEADRREGREPDPEHAALLAGIEPVLAEVPEFLAVAAKRAHYLEVAPLVAMQMFCVGWENVGARFRRVGGRLPEELLAEVPQLHALAVGSKALELLRPTETQRKN